MVDIERLVRTLKDEGGDLPSVEVKSAAGGFPDSIVPTLCAFANRPGGGTIILGLDEAAGFSAIDLPDRRAMKAALASKARTALDPPITIDIDEATVDGVPIIVAEVDELAAAQQPCRVVGGSHRGVWIRAWDGDYRASEVELQGLLIRRSQPRFDAHPAPNATTDDLDENLVGGFVHACRAGSAQLSEIRDDEELLWRMGVLVEVGRVPSVAGILALGRYPQQHLPGVGLQAVLVAGDDQPGTRALDSRRFDGPIPRMIGEATAWVARSTPTAIQGGAIDGRVVNEPRWPAEAVREIIANALIHRDLAPWALSETSLLRVDRNRLVVRNPGGLYGLTTDRLGHIGVTSARNSNLARICQYTLLPDGSRSAEVLASGIPTVLNTLRAAELPAPIFDDDGLRFTVVLRQRSAIHQQGSTQGSTGRVLTALLNGPLTVEQISSATSLEQPNIRRILRNLRAREVITQRGGRGVPTTYERLR